MSLDGKRHHILLKVLKRLYDYSVTNKSFMYDDDNPCLRLREDDRMDSKFMVTKEEVKFDMLL